MKCTVFVLSLTMLTMPACAQQSGAERRALAAEQPPAPPPAPAAPAAPPASLVPRASAILGSGSGGTSSSSRARVDVGPFGESVISAAGAVDGDPAWVMIRPNPTSRPTEKAAYVGVSVSAVPQVLRDQLKLQRGVGLVVNYVEKSSPAEAAGLRQSDVLQKLDDQILIDSRQFSVLIRIHPTDKDIRFTLIREAKPMELAVKPVERDLPSLDESSSSVPMLNLFRNASESQYRLAKVKAFGVDSSDGQHNFSISEVNGHRTLTAKDKSGKVIFEGPIDTEEQIQKVPADLREKVRRFSQWDRLVPATQPLWRLPEPSRSVPKPAAPSKSQTNSALEPPA